MGNLPLDSLAGLHSRALRDPKKARPGQVDLLVRWHPRRWGNGGGTSASNRRPKFSCCILQQSATVHDNTGNTGMKQPAGAQKFFVLHFATICNGS